MGRGRQSVLRDHARQIQGRLREYLVRRYGGLERFKDLAAHYGWFKPDTINRWFRGERVPDAPTLARLKQVTGISTDWLITGVGLARDMAGQLYLDALGAEGREPSSPPATRVGSREQPGRGDYSGYLLSPDLDPKRYRVIACRFCGEGFRQFLEDPTNPDDWSPLCCFKCREERVEIPKRRAERRPTEPQYADLQRWLGLEDGSPPDAVERALARAGLEPRARPDNLDLLGLSPGHDLGERA